MADRLPLAELSIQNEQLTPPTEMIQPIKTKKTHPLKPPKLTHPYSLDLLSSPRDKWSAMTHSLWATIMGFNCMPILYAYFYFHNGRVLLTHAYATSTTATTIRGGDNLRGSTELDDKMGDKDHRVFAHLVLWLDYGGMGTGSKWDKQRNHSFVNMLLADFFAITNLHPSIHNEIADNQQALAHALAHCSLLILGSDALTPSII
jgi:hypothetical protein